MDLKTLKTLNWWIIGLFVGVMVLRIVLSFQSANLDYDAYSTLRQAEHIKQTGLPLFHDPFSYGGKSYLFPPLFAYIIALFSFIMPLEWAARIIPNIFAALCIPLIYLIALRITKSERVGNVTAFIGGFVPVFYYHIIQTSALYLALFLMLSIIYCIIRIQERKYVDYALISMFLLVLTTPAAFVLVIGLLLYLLLLKLENMHVEMKELEIILFFTFLVSWVNLLIYKNAFLTHGILVIWQNTPTQLLSNYFTQVGFLEAFYTLSIIPLLLGIYAFYLAFYKHQQKETILLTSIGISVFVLIWFKLLPLVTGLLFLSTVLVTMTAYALKHLSQFVEKTKVSHYHKFFAVLLILLFIVTGVALSFLTAVAMTKRGPTTDDVNVLRWARERLPPDAAIFSTLDEGQFIAYHAQRKVVMDTEYLLTPNIDQRYEDIQKVFSTQFETDAFYLFDKYEAYYVFLSPYARATFDIADLSYASNPACTTSEKDSGETRLYHGKCTFSS